MFVFKVMFGGFLCRWCLELLIPSTMSSDMASEYLLKNLLTPCHVVFPVMLSGFEHVCFTLMLKIGFITVCRRTVSIFLMQHIQYALIIFSAVVIAVFIKKSPTYCWGFFFTLEEWGWQEDSHRFEVASAGAGAEHSGVQTSERKTGQNRDWAPDHRWRVSWITLAWKTCVLCWTCCKCFF